MRRQPPRRYSYEWRSALPSTKPSIGNQAPTASSPSMRRQSTNRYTYEGAPRLPATSLRVGNHAPTASLAIDVPSVHQPVHEGAPRLPRNEPSSRQPSANREPFHRCAVSRPAGTRRRSAPPRNEPSSREPSADREPRHRCAVSRPAGTPTNSVPRFPQQAFESGPSGDREPPLSMRRQSTSRYTYEWRSAPSPVRALDRQPSADRELLRRYAISGMALRAFRASTSPRSATRRRPRASPSMRRQSTSRYTYE
jgi:hypothetical protein